MSRPHICDASYDLKGHCVHCKSKPCACDEKRPTGGPKVVERIFFQRSSDGGRLASAASEGSFRGPLAPKSQWGQESVMRSMLELLLTLEESSS